MNSEFRFHISASSLFIFLMVISCTSWAQNLTIPEQYRAEFSGEWETVQFVTEKDMVSGYETWHLIPHLPEGCSLSVSQTYIQASRNNGARKTVGIIPLTTRAGGDNTPIVLTYGQAGFYQKGDTLKLYLSTKNTHLTCTKRISDRTIFDLRPTWGKTYHMEKTPDVTETKKDGFSVDVADTVNINMYSGTTPLWKVLSGHGNISVRDKNPITNAIYLYDEKDPSHFVPLSLNRETGVLSWNWPDAKAGVYRNAVEVSISVD